jgi:hypothetical protein
MRACGFSGRRVGWLSALALVALQAGCGTNANVADVSGTVTLAGKAPNLDGLSISFLSADGRAKTADVARDGSFKVTGVPVGEAQVGLVHFPPEVQQALDKVASSRPLPEQGGKVDPKLREEHKQFNPAAFKSPIPQRYLDPRTSKKSFTVEAGKENVLTWDVRP